MGWRIDLRSLPGYSNYDAAYAATAPVDPQTFSIDVAGYTHTIDLTAMRDVNGDGFLDAVDLAAEINARMQDYDVKAELNEDGFLTLWSPRGYKIEAWATNVSTPADITSQFLGTGVVKGDPAAKTPYRGGYGLDDANERASYSGAYLQNVVTRGGANQTRQNFFGVLDDISAAVRAENRDGLADKLLPAIDRFMDGLLKAISTNGALQIRYEGNTTRLETNDISMTEVHDSLVTIDLTKITTDLMAAQALYQASLAVIGYMVQPTLLDFLS
jgi:flagellin-like hook-associated protein FlgL